MFKPDGSIHICRDYKQTGNTVADCDKYLVPKTEDIFAALLGGEKFTKLDLSQAKQQLLLSPKPRVLLTVNTHKGLFQPTTLQFGSDSASQIFQRELENKLVSISFVKVRSGDILVSSKNNQDHFDNLKQVLKVIKANGLRLRLKKCKMKLFILDTKLIRTAFSQLKRKSMQLKAPKNLKSFLKKKG